MNWCSGFWNTNPMRAARSRGDAAPASTAVHGHLPARRGDDARECLDQCGLARTVRPDDGREAAGLEVEVDPVQDLGPASGARSARGRGRSAAPGVSSRRRSRRSVSRNLRRRAAGRSGRRVPRARARQRAPAATAAVGRGRSPGSEGAAPPGWRREATRPSPTSSSACSRMTSAAGPSKATRPSRSSTIARVTNAIAASRLCSTSRMARSPAATTSARAAYTSSMPWGSRLAVGSSSTISADPIARAPAIASLCLPPPER